MKDCIGPVISKNVVERGMAQALWNLVGWELPH